MNLKKRWSCAEKGLVSITMIIVLTQPWQLLHCYDYTSHLVLHCYDYTSHLVLHCYDYTTHLVLLLLT